METSPNRYYRTCELNAVASYKDGKTILSDKFYTQPFKIMKPFHIKKGPYDCDDADCVRRHPEG